MSDGSSQGEAEDHLAAVTPIRHSVFGSAIGEMVARAYKVDLSRMKRMGWHGVGENSYASRKDRIVEYLRDGGFISDLHEDDVLCRLRVLMTWDELVTTLAKKTNASKPSRVWLMDQLSWFRLESAVASGEPPSRALARELDISPTSLNTLYRMYESAGRCVSGACLRPS
jgi:hypothetical protein